MDDIKGHLRGVKAWGGGAGRYVRTGIYLYTACTIQVDNPSVRHVLTLPAMPATGIKVTCLEVWMKPTLSNLLGFRP